MNFEINLSNPIFQQTNIKTTGDSSQEPLITIFLGQLKVNY